jgi:hypothetical protein
LVCFKDTDNSLIRKCSTSVLRLIRKLIKFINLLLNIKPSFSLFKRKLIYIYLLTLDRVALFPINQDGAIGLIT